MALAFSQHVSNIDPSNIYHAKTQQGGLGRKVPGVVSFESADYACISADACIYVGHCSAEGY